VGLLLLLAVAGAAACGGDDDDADPPATGPSSTGGSTDGAGAGGGPDGDGGGEVAEPELRDELLAMQADDQRERTQESSGSWRDEERSARLAEILDEHGWPGTDLVGADGSTAAWTIAQHSDLDVDLQERALELLQAAVDEGRASAGDLAYLTDRVAANRREPQVYGTQIGCVDGEAVPGELADPDGVDERRAAAGLDPLADYLAELQPACEEEAAATGG
jgi:hypothetical protein